MERSRWEIFGENRAVNFMMIVSMAVILAVLTLVAQESGAPLILP